MYFIEYLSNLIDNYLIRDLKTLKSESDNITKANSLEVSLDNSISYYGNSYLNENVPTFFRIHC